MLVCNENDQHQMKTLIHYQHRGDPVLMNQNVDLALNVLKASTTILPDSIMNLTAE